MQGPVLQGMTMPIQQSDSVIAALDIGTTKVVVLIAEIQSDDNLNIIGVGIQSYKGSKRGVVVNIEATTKAIQKAVQEAELMAGINVQSMVVGIAGSHINSINSHGIVAIKNREVSQSDIERVIDAAKAVSLHTGQRIIHILPQEYTIDDQDGISDPIGMSGIRLEAKVHIVTAAIANLQNIIKCVESCNIKVTDIILEQLASSCAVLTDDEKDLGVCLVDIGGGTTDIAVFVEGSIRHSAVIPIAGDQVTHDIAVALRTPTQHAETIKLSHASVLPSDIDPETCIEVPSTAKRETRSISKRFLSEVVEARYEELLSLVRKELRRSGFEDLAASGIVLTGGASSIPGIRQLAEQRIFKMPTRIAKPTNIHGQFDQIDAPIYATSVGLLRYACQQQDYANSRQHTFTVNLWDKMRQWFQYNF